MKAILSCAKTVPTKAHVLKLVYIHNELLHVSTNDVFIFRDVKIQRLDTVRCKMKLKSIRISPHM